MIHPTHPRYLPDRDRTNDWYLDEDFTFQMRNGNYVTIKKGFKWDSHSVPILFRLATPRYIHTEQGTNNDIYAALIHDVLVAAEHWLPYTRAMQDAEYAYYMKVYQMTWWRRFIMPKAVWLYGFIAYTLWWDYRGLVEDGEHVHYVISGAERVV